MAKAPCYNTGKVRIGASYVPPAPLPDADAERVQRALLGERESPSLTTMLLQRGFFFAGMVALMTFDQWAK